MYLCVCLYGDLDGLIEELEFVFAFISFLVHQYQVKIISV